MTAPMFGTIPIPGSAPTRHNTKLSTLAAAAAGIAPTFRRPSGIGSQERKTKATAASVAYAAQLEAWARRRGDPVYREQQRAKANEARLASYRKSRDADPERMRADWRRRKHLKRLRRKDQSDGTLTRDAVGALFADAAQCPYCDALLTVANKALDHVHPLALGGLHGIGNVVIACRDCNQRKHAKPLARWLEEIGRAHLVATLPAALAGG